MSTHDRERNSNDLFDIVIIGNGTAAAGAVARVKEVLRADPGRKLSVLVVDAATEQARQACIPEYCARVTFPHDLPVAVPELESAVITWYENIAYYSHRASVHKALPRGCVALVDVYKLIALLERDLPPQIALKWHRQVYDARYVQTAHGEAIELWVQYPFGAEKVFEDTDRLYARSVIDCSGTGSILLDRMQGYRHDATIVCGVLGFKVIGAKLPDAREWSLGVDDSITHGAGSWSYPNDGISPAMTDYLDAWLRDVRSPRTRKLTQGKRAKDFAGTIADVGISSIAPYANAQHYQSNLERQADELFQRLPGYQKMFHGAAVIPGSAFFKPSPVLQPVAQMAGRRYLLAGDAAGHATPYIGEGVRPGMDMGYAAAGILLDALANGDFSEATLRSRYEAAWWEKYGHFDIWSDLFRHFSSTSFGDKEWDTCFEILRALSADEFYSVLRSEYSTELVRKMFPYKVLPHYLAYQSRRALDTLRHRMTVRQAVSWLR